MMPIRARSGAAVRAVRGARTAAAFDLLTVAAAANLSGFAAAKALRSLPARGVCARHAATLLEHHDASAAGAARHRTLSPARARLAASAINDFENARGVLRGTAGWTSRIGHDQRAPRSTWVQWAEHLHKRQSGSYINRALAGDRRTPPLMLHRLMEHHDELVREAAVLRPGCPSSLFTRAAVDTAVLVRETVAARSDCPETLLERLAGDDAHDVRAAVAGNARTSPAVVQRLAGDRHRTVRSAAAAHPACDKTTVPRTRRDDTR